MQGSADSRFCIRLSGADVVIGGEPEGPISDELGGIADRANIKGFAFEYMTSGRAVVLGDIGPWACAGQTGGRVYMRVNEEWGLDREALERRLGKGAKVALRELDDRGRRRRAGAARPLRAGARALRAARGGASASAAIAADAARALPDVGAGARADRPVGLDRVARHRLQVGRSVSRADGLLQRWRRSARARRRGCRSR